MAYLSLYRKYRPQTFTEVVGQDHVSITLANALKEGRVAHSYLFTGPRGTGKTSMARILAKALNCVNGPTPTPCGVCEACMAIAEGSSLDVIEMDAASHSKVDETREILAGVALATAGGKTKVYVIDEVHMLSTGSFNALLKTLEEPPDHVVFVLATTEAHKVLDTIISRTQRFDFKRIPAELLEAHLAKVAQAEGIDIEGTALAEIARRAEGSARDALSALDQLSSLTGHVSAAQADALLGERREDSVVELFDALAAGDLGTIFGSVQALVARGADVRQTALGVMDHARSLLLLKTAPDAELLLDVSEEDRAVLGAQVEHFTVGALLRTLDLLGKAVTEMRNAPGHRLLLEVALVRAAAPETDPSSNGLLGRIERLERRLGLAPDVASGDTAVQRGRAADEKATAETGRRSKPVPESPRKEEPPAGKTAGAPAAQPATDVSDVPPQVGLGDIKSAWQATLQEVKRRSKRIWGMLNPSRPVNFHDGDLTIEVQSSFHQSEMTHDRNRKIVADSLQAALGIRPEIRFVALQRDGTGTTAEATEPGATDYSEASGAPAHVDDPIELVKKGLHAEVVEEIGER